MHMKRIRILIGVCLLAFFSACSKHTVFPAIPPDSISFQGVPAIDTMVSLVSVTKDTVITVDIKTVSMQPVAQDTHVVIATDTLAMATYHAKYGDALLLPSNAYFFFRPDAYIPAGSKQSDAAEINVVKESKLEPDTTYVLPLNIQSVDNQTADPRSEHALFLVIRTGHGTYISKRGWTIASVSSEYPGGPATNLLDNSDDTFWMNDFVASDGAMPQQVTIDFGAQLTFSDVEYSTSSANFNAGVGFPTRLEIELSDDGLKWTDKGNFEGPTSDAPQVIPIGTSTARFLRFTVLAVPSALGYNLLEIGSLNLVK